MKTFKDTKYGDLTGQVYKGNINVFSERLDSLEGAPREVIRKFDCRYNNLKNLKGAPEIVHDDFICSNNQKLETLEGGPKEVYKRFKCERSDIKNLKGSPKEVHSNFLCSYNKKLESLEGAPKLVTGDFICVKCPKLTSLDGLLGTEIKGKLYSDIMTDKEFRENQELYNKVGKNMKKYKLLKKLKDIK